MASEQQQQAEPTTPLGKLTARVASIVQETGHGEMWGVELGDAAAAPVQVVLQKFLRANGGDAAAAEKQFAAALAWRSKVQPLKLAERVFDAAKFGDLGFVTVHREHEQGGRQVVVTWNIYGAVKDNKTTFGDVQEFINWRAALMELSIQKLNLNSITQPLASNNDKDDPYRMVQVHDYRSVSFFRMDPLVKAASRETIQTFSTAYPELLSHKYFVNVPSIMGWVFGAMKLFLAPATLRKFHPMASGMALAGEMTSVAPSLPVEYGGKGPSVREGETVKLGDAAQAAAANGTSGTTATAHGAAAADNTTATPAATATTAAAATAAATAPATATAAATAAKDEQNKSTVPDGEAEKEKPADEATNNTSVVPLVVEPANDSTPEADLVPTKVDEPASGAQAEMSPVANAKPIEETKVPAQVTETATNGTTAQ
ncbi:hypothetical protein CDD81_722 [Ophiocordyceps australis]|uniref:Phosphatidylinositol transfer protein SFH5 n=1 Tax=Ophiocordyceps australis TaxID=1399860 RepID=A0A2C5Y2F4_9HYPO|nr:hypothetical protein CDD81_722 [Ophiocordyceps australis]